MPDVDNNTLNPLLAAREKWRALKAKKAEAEAKLAAQAGVSAQPIPTVSFSRIDFSPLGEDLEDEEGTPVKDEALDRAGTPVQDEMEISPVATVCQESREDSQSSVSNPIEFLTQLINQNHQSKQGSTDFLQSLSALTRNVTHQYTPKDNNAVDGWGGWKDPSGIQHEQAYTPQPVQAPQAVQAPGPVQPPVMPPPQPVQPPHSLPAGLSGGMGVPMSQISPITPPSGMLQSMIPGLGMHSTQGPPGQIPGLGNTPPTPPPAVSQGIPLGQQIPGLGNPPSEQIPGLGNITPHSQPGLSMPAMNNPPPLHNQSGPLIPGLGAPSPHILPPPPNSMQQDMSLPPPQPMPPQTPPNHGMAPHTPQHPRHGLPPPQHTPPPVPAPPPQSAQGFQSSQHARFPGMVAPPRHMPRPNMYGNYESTNSQHSNVNSWTHNGGPRTPQTPTHPYNQQSPPLGSTPMFSRPNLTTIQTTGDLDHNSDNTHNMPTPSHHGFRPVRPSVPPGGMRLQSPRGIKIRPPDSPLELQDEFREKLRRRTSLTSPPTPGMSLNLRNLTLVPTEDTLPTSTIAPKAVTSTSPSKTAQAPINSKTTTSDKPASTKATEVKPPKSSEPVLRPHRAANDWGGPAKKPVKPPETKNPEEKVSEPVGDTRVVEHRVPEHASLERQALGQRALRTPRMEDRNPSPGPDRPAWPSDMMEPPTPPPNRPPPTGHNPRHIERDHHRPPYDHRPRRPSHDDFRDPYGAPLAKRPPPPMHPHRGFQPRY